MRAESRFDSGEPSAIAGRMHRILNKNGESAVFSRLLAELLRLKSESRFRNAGKFLCLHCKYIARSLVSFHSELN